MPGGRTARPKPGRLAGQSNLGAVRRGRAATRSAISGRRPRRASRDRDGGLADAIEDQPRDLATDRPCSIGGIGYTSSMASPRPASAADKTAAQETVERAARIVAMLDRWNAEDVSKEPDWSVADLEPVTLRHGTEDEKPRP
jgi:hypothetical protein